jgi:hypothetical protein
MKVLREQVSDIETKLRQSEERAQRARDEASRRKKKRVGWIFAPIFTFGNNF